MTNTNRLYRSNTDKVIGGVAGGIADYLDIDPVIIRILFVLLAIFGGSGVLVYIILWIAIPEKSFVSQLNEMEENPDNDQQEKVFAARRSNTGLVAGIVLIAFGLLFLFDNLIPFYHVFDLWPLILIVAGVLLIKPELFKTSKKIES